MGLVAPWHVGSSQTRDWTCVPLHWQTDSNPLYHQRSPNWVLKLARKWKCYPLSSVWFFATPWTVVCQALLSWDFPGKDTGVGSHYLLQGIFLTQGLNLGLLHCRQILYHLGHRFSSVQLLSHVRLCHPMDCSMPGFPVHHQLPELTQIHVHRVGDAIQPSHPLSSPSPPAFNLSQHQGLFQWIGSLHQVPKYWSFSFSISPSNECSGWFPLGMDWLDLLAVQGTLKSFLQYHSSKASILRCSAFFIVQLSHPYMTTAKTIALTRWTFVGKVKSLLFNRLCSLVKAFLPRSKHLLISWLKSPSAVILELPFPPQKSLSLFPLFPHLFAMKWWDWMISHQGSP